MPIINIVAHIIFAHARMVHTTAYYRIPFSVPVLGDAEVLPRNDAMLLDGLDSLKEQVSGIVWVVKIKWFRHPFFNGRWDGRVYPMQEVVRGISGC